MGSSGRPRNEAPLLVAELTEVPGKDWNKDQLAEILSGLTEEGTLKKLLILAAASLPYFANTEDCEDAVQSFMCFHLKAVLLGFDPGVPGAVGLWQYISVCFKRFCRKRGEALTKSRARE